KWGLEGLEIRCSSSWATGAQGLAKMIPYCRNFFSKVSVQRFEISRVVPGGKRGVFHCPYSNARLVPSLMIILELFVFRTFADANVLEYIKRKTKESARFSHFSRGPRGCEA